MTDSINFMGVRVNIDGARTLGDVADRFRAAGIPVVIHSGAVQPQVPQDHGISLTMIDTLDDEPSDQEVLRKLCPGDGEDLQETAKNTAYTERNALVALVARLALSAGYRAGVADDAESPGWKVIFVDLPTGQVSWHVHENEVATLPALPVYDGVWDKHTTNEKWARVNACSSITERADRERDEAIARMEIAIGDNRAAQTECEAAVRAADEVCAALVRVERERNEALKAENDRLVDRLEAARCDDIRVRKERHEAIKCAKAAESKLAAVTAERDMFAAECAAERSLVHDVHAARVAAEAALAKMTAERDEALEDAEMFEEAVARQVDAKIAAESALAAVRAERARDYAMSTQAHTVAALREQESLCRHILKQRDEARAALELRPEVSAEDAAEWLRCKVNDDYTAACTRVAAALRTHAAKAKVTT